MTMEKHIDYVERFNKEVYEELPPNKKAAFDTLRMIMDPKHDLKLGPLAEALALANIYHAVANPNRGVNILAPFLGDRDAKEAIRNVWNQKFHRWEGTLDIKEQPAIIIYRPVPGKGMFDNEVHKHE